MSDKDFAHVESTHFEHSDATVSNTKSILITLSAVAFAIICFSVGFFMGEEHGLETLKGNKHTELVEKLQSQQQELNTLKEEAEKWQQQEANTSQVGELTFYNELPAQSIIPEPLNAEAIAKPDFLDALAAKTAQKLSANISNEHDDIEATEKELEDIIRAQLDTSSRTFRIQVASFRQQHVAERLVPKLSNIGVKANVQRVELNNMGVYYRVYTESYDKEQQAIKTKLLIKEKMNFKGIMIQNG